MNLNSENLDFSIIDKININVNKYIEVARR